MGIEEASRRDQILRSYIGGRDWDPSAEFQLVRALVSGSQRLLPDHPYVFDYEWPAGGIKGDLLFSDGSNSFAVVEVKSTEGAGNRTDRRNHVERQAIRCAEGVARQFPGAAVLAYVYTDDPAFPGLRRADAPRARGVTLDEA